MFNLQVKSVTYGFEGQPEPIFEDVSFELSGREKVGLIGPNGSGKTTLMRIVYGEVLPLKGQVIKPKRGISIGFLRQTPLLSSPFTLLDEVKGAFPRLLTLKREMEILEGSNEASVLRRYGKLQEEFEAMGGYRLENRIQSVLYGLGFEDLDLCTPYDLLSSGQKSKAQLAKFLLEEPELLLLDEPTNHLDIEALEWLEEWLSFYKRAVLVVSHDRFFLDRVVDKILQLNRKSLRTYSGNYSFYQQQKEIEERKAWEDYKKQRRKVKKMKREASQRKVWAKRREKDRIGGGGAKGYITHRAAKMAKRAKAVEKRVEHLLEKEKMAKPWVEKRIKIDFDLPLPSGELLLEVEDISKSYGEKRLFSGLSFSLLKGENLAVIGPNGSGKTTLFKLILGLEDTDEGRIRLGDRVKIGYYPQEREGLDPEHTVLQEVLGGQVDQTFARTILGCLKFRKGRVYERVGELSVGERGKVVIARLLLSRCNLLILDEPTNHLDIEARIAVEEALLQFPGTILFTSHDRYFLRKLSHHIIEMEDGVIHRYEGGWDYYQMKRITTSKTT